MIYGSVVQNYDGHCFVRIIIFIEFYFLNNIFNLSLIKKGLIMFKSMIFLFVLVFTCSIYAQGEVGKIYSKSAADSIYGQVLASVPVQSSLLSDLTNKTINYLMFRISDGNLIILDYKRNVLYPTSATVNPADVYRYFSISLIRKIISDGNAGIVTIETRNNNIITLTDGLFTLEFGVHCPPNCP